MSSKSPILEKAKALLKEADVDPSKHTIEFVSWQVPYAQIAVQMIRRLGFKVHHVALDDIGTQKRRLSDDWDLTVMSFRPALRHLSALCPPDERRSQPSPLGRHSGSDAR